MRVASLDLGSNSFLLLIAEVRSGKILEVLHDEQVVTRLGQEVHENRYLHPEALARAESCFSHYKKIIDSYKVEKVQAVSTSAARDVKNKKDFIDLGKKYDIPIQIVSGSDEAKLTYYGTLDSESSQASIIDVGGGSTEIIGLNNGIVKGWSLDIGSVRLTEIFDAFDKVGPDKLQQIDEYIVNQLKKNASQLPQIKQAIAVAGTPTTLACLLQKLQFSADKVEGYKLSSKNITEMRSNLAAMSLQDKKNLTGIHPKRADVLVCGTSILKNICDFFKLDEYTVSCKGVRFGLAKKIGS